jgi:PAS domain S-box-containing protein
MKIRDEAYKTALSTGVLHYESRIIWNDQSIHWVEAKGSVFFDEERQPIKMLGIARDITADKNHQQALEKSEQKFRLLADSMPQYIWTSDPEGNLNYFNKSVFDYTGFSSEQLANEGFLDILHPEDREENVRRWRIAVTTGKDFLFEHRFRKYDGEYRWQLSRAIPQRDSAGNIQMWVGTSTDIQDQKTFASELERQVKDRTAQLAQQNTDLEKMNRELQSFAYVSSHDLQEPLRKIQTFASRIRDKELQNLSEKGADYFRRIQDAANRMQTLIQDLLAYSRTNTTEPVFKKTHLKEIVEEVKTDFYELLTEKEGRIECNEMCDVNIIPFQFRQLMYNLIGNSIKFSKPNVPPVITVDGAMIDASSANLPFHPAHQFYCHISIADNGIGFDPKYQDRIFEVFQRLHGKDEYSGTGIGLAIVKKIVENHKGIITASGVVNEGARFDIYLPYR